MFTKTFLLFTFFLFAAHAPAARAGGLADDTEFNPFAPGAESALERFDRAYEDTTGLSAYPAGHGDQAATAESCYREGCAFYVDIDKASQTLRFYLDGRLTDQWPVSTGRAGFETPDFNKHFDGRIFQHYDSTTFPGGDYMGLGNMPYAMFISGGVALHGTPEGNWPLLGRRASHGCIRLHPDHAKYLNGLLRQYGVQNSWVWVH